MFSKPQLPKVKEVSENELAFWREIDPDMDADFDLRGYLESGGIMDIVAVDEEDEKRINAILKKYGVLNQ